MRHTKSCNMCGNQIQVRSRFILFCGECRRKDTFRFNEWLPETEVSLS